MNKFLIITHRKGTMEAADTIYGVTMEEKGISKLLSIIFLILPITSRGSFLIAIEPEMKTLLIDYSLFLSL